MLLVSSNEKKKKMVPKTFLGLVKIKGERYKLNVKLLLTLIT